MIFNAKVEENFKERNREVENNDLQSDIATHFNFNRSKFYSETSQYQQI